MLNFLFESYDKTVEFFYFQVCHYEDFKNNNHKTTKKKKKLFCRRTSDFVFKLVWQLFIHANNAYLAKSDNLSFIFSELMN